MGTGEKEAKGAKPLDVNEPPQRVRRAARNGSLVGGLIGGIIGGLIGALICCYCQRR